MRLRLAGHGHGHGHHRGRWLLVAAALAFLVLMLLAPRAHGAKGMEVAVQDDFLFTRGVSVAGFNGRDVGLGYARDLGATRIRVNVGWNTVLDASQRNLKKAPKRPKYNWAVYDELIVASARYGIKPQFNLNGPAPRWATGDLNRGKYDGANKPKAKYYRGFVAAAVRHFKGRIDRYSVWNEPNYRGWIDPPEQAGRIYRQLYLAAYKEIKKGDPQAKVFIGETSPYFIGSKRKTNATAPLAFLRQMTCSNKTFTRSKCPGLKADGYAHHPYDFTHKPTYKWPGKDNATLATIGNLTKALDRMKKSKALRTPRGKALDLYLTEYGFFRQGKKRTPESKRGKYLVQGFEIARKNRRVKQMLQYLIVEPGAGYKFFDTSLVTEGGQKTPAYDTFRAWSSGALQKGQIAAPGPVDPTLFSGSGGSQPSGGGGGSTGGSGGGTTSPGGGTSDPGTGGGGSTDPGTGGGGSTDPGGGGTTNPPPDPDNPGLCDLFPPGFPGCN